MIPYSYPISGWRDKLVSYNGINFEYDNLGNPTKYMNNTLVWSHGRQLVKFGDIAEYTYNANGIRTSKKTNGFTTLYYLSDDKIIRQHDQLNVLDFYYGIDGISGFHISSQNAVYKGTPLNHYFYYKKNLQGDIIGIIDADGEEIVHYVYDAWGNHKAIDGKTSSTLDISSYDSYTNTSNIVQFIATKNPFRYRSYYYDYETGLYYLNSRYYNPEIGRFINADDVEYLDADTINGLNLYAYCGSNPANLIDPFGQFPVSLQLLNKLVRDSNDKRKKPFVSFNLEHSWSLFNGIYKYLFVNVEYTLSTSPYSPDTFHGFTSTGINGIKSGVGVNLFDKIGVNVYYNTDISVGFELQLSPIHVGASIGLDGIGVNFGISIGNTTHDINVNVSWITAGLCTALLVSPVPGSRVVAFFVFLFDLIF